LVAELFPTPSIERMGKPAAPVFGEALAAAVIGPAYASRADHREAPAKCRRRARRPLCYSRAEDTRDGRNENRTGEKGRPLRRASLQDRRRIADQVALGLAQYDVQHNDAADGEHNECRDYEAVTQVLDYISNLESSNLI
jgi:hypothetical protein